MKAVRRHYLDSLGHLSPAEYKRKYQALVQAIHDILNMTEGDLAEAPWLFREWLRLG